ncbi:unnamed protein product [Rotaria sordida]|uniref:Uncharacterized protein n=1 Tax=Rotaria sordida TaxID=392033 RepID=A0A818TKT1_9BILA|nr:unnamed protein product [Rotaria sordida]
MIPNIGLKRKSSLDNSNVTTTYNNPISTLTKRFRGTTYDGKNHQNEYRMSLLSSSTTLKSKHDSKKMTILNGEQNHTYKRLDESKMTPVMLTEYRRLQHELQCQEALLVLMQKLKTNQRLISQTNNTNTTNTSIKQRTTTTTITTPTTATKLNQQSTDVKTPILATKQQQQNNSNRSTPTKTPHPNQYTVNRSNNNNSQIAQQQSSKNSQSIPQAIRQSNNTNTNTNNTLLPPATATRISSTVPTSATKNSSNTSTASNSSKSNGVAAEQHLLNAKLALRKQLEQTLLQIPTPKPSTCDLTFIPGVNGWSEFLAFLGLEQALNTYTDIVNRRSYEISMNLPNVCVQCGTDWSVTWHEMSSNSDTNSDDKILCDRCTKTSQKKLLKQDHSNRLRQAFIKALQQEKELDAKFQQQSTTTTTTTTSSSSTPTTNTVKQSSSTQQQHSKHVHQTNKHSNKPLSTKTSSNHHHHHHQHNNNSINHNHHSHSHHHHHHHTGKSSSSSSSSKNHNTNPTSIPTLNPTSAETLASTLAALQTNEQMEFFQKHFLSNMLPFAVANQAAALAAKTTQQQQQQQAALAALPAMAASLMRQQNPAQYLLDMIPQAAKQQHHHHSK